MRQEPGDELRRLQVLLQYIPKLIFIFLPEYKKLPAAEPGARRTAEPGARRTDEAGSRR